MFKMREEREAYTACISMTSTGETVEARRWGAGAMRAIVGGCFEAMCMCEEEGRRGEWTRQSYGVAALWSTCIAGR